MNLQSITIFLRVVREGSFSAAGRGLGLSPTAIARHISSLEADLSAQLFHRSSRKLGLTEAGRTYHDRISPLIEAMREAADAVSTTNAAPAGQLRVHCRTTVGTLVIAPAIPRFLAEHPGIRLTVLLSNATAVDMIGDNYDIDIQVGAQPDSSLRARLLARNRSIACATPDYIEKHPPIRTPADLSDHNCLTYHYGAAQPVPEWTFTDRRGISRTVAVSGTLDTDNGVVLQAALRNGLGIAVVPRWAVEQQLAEGSLVQLLPDHDVRQSGAGTAVYALFHASRQESAKVRSFIDFLARLFAER